MKFSLTTAEITPQGPIFLAGFGDRTHKSEGVHEPLFAKAALIQANTTLLIITLDVVGSDRSFIVGIKNILEEKFGLKHEEVLINFSHTHHSVALTGADERLRVGLFSIGKDFSEDVSFYGYIRDTLVSIVDECFSQLEEGTLLLGRGTSDFAISRRKLTADGVKWAPYPEAEIDKDLIVLKLVDQENEVRGILYNYGCHPTSMSSDNYMISNDFPGTTSRYLEETYPGVTALFLQGCAGELKPIKSADGDIFKSCSLTEMEEAGRDLAKDIISILEEQPFTPIRCSFRTILVDPLLYMEQTGIPFYENIINDSKVGDFRKRGAHRTIEQIQDGSVKDRTPIYLSIWHLDEETRLIAMEGEISTEYSLLLKSMFPGGKTIVLGYTNGVYYYVPTRKMIAEGGYEVDCNYCFGGFRGSFVPEIEDIIIGQITKADLLLRTQSQPITHDEEWSK
ncbi:neutral/alkaline non-lysosomal ceramidase N-terminal domain-containing protein [Paenibacillus qinlingensis]|uniref:neutral/alkaline non-lysosomal ceramidase N-terminal domain-containing protein n=1 Tax=Paenibacillus qinlingensis TaxID=1837343 RepID=UPI0015634047|nr:neutral/alkaline non-lysosomal ceramidase N-terminal domain-containing protein [Paenibacillus qinlingensis]NQX64228.1 neutral/alkaline non-lysosomal ceramidase N-terminal domain-containing protein [Paenibacillus qinlingensis]